MNRLVNLIATEPALVRGAVAAGLTAAIAFGAPITPDQKAAVLGVVGPALILVAAFLTRQAVTPTASIGKLQ